MLNSLLMKRLWVLLYCYVSGKNVLRYKFRIEQRKCCVGLRIDSAGEVIFLSSGMRLQSKSIVV